MENKKNTNIHDDIEFNVVLLIAYIYNKSTVNDMDWIKKFQTLILKHLLTKASMHDLTYSHTNLINLFLSL